MKIEKRVKGLLRFKTSIGNVTLTDDNKGINELSAEQFAAIEAHPMFEAFFKTCGLRFIVEAPVVAKKATKVEDSEKNVDLNEIDLEAQNKATLIHLAQSLEIETDGLTKAQLIEAINSKK